MNIKRTIFFVIGLVVIIFIGLVLGFFIYGLKGAGVTVSGTVTDIIETPIPNQKVELISDSGTYQAVSDQQGRFEFPSVPVQSYTLIASQGDEWQAREIDLETDLPSFILNVPVLTGDFDFMPPVKENDVAIRHDGLRAVKGEVVVRWKEGLAKSDREGIAAKHDAKVLSDTPEIYLSILAVQNEQVDNTVKKLNSESNVIAAAPSYILDSNIEPEEGEYKEEEKNWWLKKINAEPAWDISTGSPYHLVGVVDGGFTLDHEDLSKAFVSAKANYTDEEISADADHGTHVTGIVGMRMNNNKGLVGIAPDTRMAVAKTYSMVRAADAFRFFSRCPSVKVISISMGKNWWSTNKWRNEHGLPDLTEEEKQNIVNDLDAILNPAVDLAASKDKLIVHSAGNDSGDASLNSLDFDEVLTVAASDKNDGLANFSNFGGRVDIAAPGVKIYSSIPGGYDYKSGTSMATPLTAGTAALIRAKNPKLKYDEVKKVLTDTAVDVTGLSGHDFGRLDAWRALLKATGRMGVEGSVFDEELFDFVEGAEITGSSIASALSDKEGNFRISALPWQDVELKAVKDQKTDEQTAFTPLDDYITYVNFELKGEEKANTNGSAANQNINTNTAPEPEADVYMVWEGTNASVGIWITTKEKFEAEELASSYAGGGISDTKILEKEDFAGQTFTTKEAGTDWICNQLTDIRYYPFIGLGGKYNDETKIIGNFNCPE